MEKDRFLIEATGIRKAFLGKEVLKNIGLMVKKSDVIAIIGSSGSGKSTLLRCLIGLEKMDGGTVKIEGEPLIEQGRYRPLRECHRIYQKMGMVFQGYNLFPHYTVRENLEKPYRLLKGKGKEEAYEKSTSLLNKVGMLEWAGAYPSTLSGGQEQRAAIARALMMEPEILLFDEPTSALDPQLTADVLAVMQEMAKEKMTMVVVTHEMGFARHVANQVMYMADGEVVEASAPEEIFLNPKQEKTRLFLDSVLRQ